METAVEIGTLKANQEAQDKRMTKLEEKLSDNLERIYSKLDRPSWLAASIIAFLSSGFFTMLTVVLMRPAI